MAVRALAAAEQGGGSSAPLTAAAVLGIAVT